MKITLSSPPSVPGPLLLPSPRPRCQLTAPLTYSYINLYCDYLTFAYSSWNKQGGWGRFTFLLSPHSRYPIKIILYYSICHLYLYLSQGIQQFIFFPIKAWAVGKKTVRKAWVASSTSFPDFLRKDEHPGKSPDSSVSQVRTHSSRKEGNAALYWLLCTSLQGIITSTPLWASLHVQAHKATYYQI